MSLTSAVWIINVHSFSFCQLQLRLLKKSNDLSPIIAIELNQLFQLIYLMNSFISYQDPPPPPPKPPPELPPLKPPPEDPEEAGVLVNALDMSRILKLEEKSLKEG